MEPRELPSEPSEQPHRLREPSPDDLGLDAAPRRRGPGARAILFAGVAGACALGVGLGLWARPGANERRIVANVAPVAAPPADPDRRLRIVVDDKPAPGGEPIEVLPHVSRPMFAAFRSATPDVALSATPDLTHAPPAATPKLEAPRLGVPKLEIPKLQAPRLPALPNLQPLMIAAMAAPGHWLEKIKAAEPHRTELAEAAPVPESAPAKAAHHRRPADADSAHAAIRLAAQKAQAQAEEDTAAKAAVREAALEKAAQRKAATEKAQTHRVELAKAAEAKAAAARLQQAKLQQAKLQQAKAAKIQQAKLDRAKAAQAKLQQVRLAQIQAKADAQAKAADRAQQLRLAKAQKAEAVRLAQAEAKGRAEAQAQARAEAHAMVLAEAKEEARKRERLEALVHAVQKALPHAQTQTVQTAKLDRKAQKAARRHDAVVEQAALKTRKPPPHAVQPTNRNHPALVAPAPPSGLMKVSAPRCASHDPGEALVCADPNLGAADRQLARAYQGARAAGVPDAQLRQDQQRWLAARSAAAREAPWAVHDVYLARIAELNSQAREAHGDGY
jgi:hypothetical protein